MADIISVLALTMSEEGDRVRHFLLTLSYFYCKKFLSICFSSDSTLPRIFR